MEAGRTFDPSPQGPHLLNQSFPRRIALARILVTDPLDAEGLDLLRKRGHDVVDATKLEGPARQAEVAKAEAWMVRSGTNVRAEDLAAASRLRAIGRAGVGVDNVDLAAATARGVAVFHAPTGNITSAA